MTGRERLQAMFHKEPMDSLAWTTHITRHTLDALPGDLKGMSGIDFYRHIGCDMLLLNGANTPYAFSAPTLEWPDGVTETVRDEGEMQYRELQTPFGTLESERRKGHPTKYPVGTLADVRVYRELWEGAKFTESDDGPVLDRINAVIGDDGVVTRFPGPSTIPRLLEVEMGTQNFYYLLHDHKEEMEGLISAMHEKELEAWEIISRGPCDVIILCENTSTFYISPNTYRNYSGPQVRDFVDIMHAAGKVAILHMCGHVRTILDLIKETGLDGIHALTPPPTGDTPWEVALDELGEDLIIIGIIDPSIFIMGSLEEIPEALNALYTPRVRRSNFCLWPGADGLAVPLERFEAVAAWMDKNGRRN